MNTTTSAWLMIVVSVVVCGSVAWSFWLERHLTQHYTSQVGLLRQARIDLAKGYLHIVLAETPESPFDRKQGLALMDQAVATMNRALVRQREFEDEIAESGPDDDVHSLVAALQQTASALHKVASTVRSSQERAGQQTELRSAIYALERQTDVVDAQIERDLSVLVDRYRVINVWVIAVSAVLLSCVCLVVYLGNLARRRVEIALKDSEASFRNLFDAVPDPVFICDFDAGILQVNRSACRRLGWSEAELLRMTIRDIDAPEFRENFPKAAEELRLKGSVVLETAHIRKDGTRIPAEVSATVTCFRGVAAILGVVRDLTERKRAEEDVVLQCQSLERQVHERTVQLEAASKELQAFTYSVSHDLRAPLRGIDGWSRALLEDFGSRLDEKGRVFINRILAETRRMGTLIDDFLQLSRLSQAELFCEPLDLTALATSVAEQLKERSPERSVEFVIQPGLAATGDRKLVETVLQNLLGNAHKYTSKGAQARIEFGRMPTANGEAFFVRDDGVGFDMAYASKLFGTFQRLHKSSEFSGAGVGLAAVQRIVHRHGGRVWAEATVDHGATFWFTLGDEP